MATSFSYGKKEKLKSRKLTEQLFKKGRSFTVFPLKVFYLEPSEILDFPVKAGVGASSRHFAKATDRNRIKRLLREAYRTEKNTLLRHVEKSNQQLVLFFLFIDKQLPEYVEIKQKMPVLLDRLIKKLDETTAANT